MPHESWRPLVNARCRNPFLSGWLRVRIGFQYRLGTTVNDRTGPAQDERRVLRARPSPACIVMRETGLAAIQAGIRFKSGLTQVSVRPDSVLGQAQVVQ